MKRTTIRIVLMLLLFGTIIFMEAFAAALDMAGELEQYLAGVDIREIEAAMPESAQAVLEERGFDSFGELTSMPAGELWDIIKERLNKQAAIGFMGDLKDKYDEDPNLLMKVTVEDLRNFGMIPEFIGRLPIIFSLSALTKDMLVRILKEPRNAILKQYQKLLALDEVELTMDDEALEAIAEKALEKRTGARALRAIIEEFMLDIMYEIPKDENIGSVRITREYIEHTGGPVISLRNVVPQISSKER